MSRSVSSRRGDSSPAGAVTSSRAFPSLRAGYAQKLPRDAAMGRGWNTPGARITEQNSEQPLTAREGNV